MIHSSSLLGHGYAASQKRKFLSRFNRKFKKNSANSSDAPKYTEPKPLADDTLMSHSSKFIKTEWEDDTTLADSIISGNESDVSM